MRKTKPLRYNEGIAFTRAIEAVRYHLRTTQKRIGVPRFVDPARISDMKRGEFQEEYTVYEDIESICMNIVDMSPKIDNSYFENIILAVPLTRDNKKNLIEKIKKYQKNKYELPDAQEKLPVVADEDELELYEQEMQDSPIVGRDQDIKDVITALQDKRCPIVTIAGLTGVGKTRLVLEVRKEVRNNLAATLFPGGCIYLSLASVVNPDEIPYRIAERLKVAGEPTAERIAASLPDRPALLIIDNLDHVTIDKKQLRFFNALFAKSKQKPLKWLFTSQVPLYRQEKECVIYLNHLELPPADDRYLTKAERPIISGDDLQQYASTALFYQYAKIPDYKEWDIKYVIRLCRDLAGLPLAIKLAASLVKGRYFLSNVCDDLSMYGLSILTNYELEGLDKRHVSLEQPIVEIYNHLRPQAQVLFNRLSLFVNDFFVFDAINHICNAEGDLAKNQEELKSLIGELVRFNWLKRERGVLDFYYSTLQVLSLFARKKLEGKPEEYKKLRARFAAYFLNFVEVHSGRLGIWEHHNSVLQVREVSFALLRERNNIEKARRYYSEINDLESSHRIDDGMIEVYAYLHPELHPEFYMAGLPVRVGDHYP